MPPLNSRNLLRFGIPLLIVWFLLSEGIYYWQASPRKRASMSDFSGTLSTESSVRIFESNIGELWEYQGRLPHFLLFAFPSAPPLYFFQPNGDYIGWVMDPAEMHIPDDWRPKGSMEVLHYQDAMRRFYSQPEAEE